MFLGHFGVAFAGKRAAPRVSLGVLVASAMWLDIIWPVLLLLGWESASIVPGDTVVTPLRFDHYPISHSLLAVVGWAVAGGAVMWARSRSRRAALVVALLIASHWMLDWLVHRPDLPLFPGGPKTGLGLWSSLPSTLGVEALLFVAGVAIYTKSTRATDGKGRWGWVWLVGFLVTIYLVNVFGPPPPGMRAVAWAGLALCLLPLWSGWLDQHRTLRADTGGAPR